MASFFALEWMVVGKGLVLLDSNYAGVVDYWYLLAYWLFYLLTTDN
jgi:hypothetical protein